MGALQTLRTKTPGYPRRFLRAGPLAVLAAGAAIGVVGGSFVWPLLGLIGSALLALPTAWSRDGRLLARVASATKADRVGLADLLALRSRVRAVQGIPGTEHEALKLRAQFEGAAGHYLGFVRLLEEKFDPGELTHGRYLRSGEQVYLALLDEIQRAAVALETLRGTDLDTLRSEVRMLRRRAEADPGGADPPGLPALERRIATYDDEVARVGAILADNEDALASLSQATASLARVETSGGRVAVDATTAMRELEALAERAQRYAVRAPTTVNPPPVG